MDYNSKTFSVMTIDGLHYIKSVIVSDNPCELTLLCDTSWESEVFEVPATVVYHGKEYTVTGIDVGQSTQLKTLRELRIPPTVRHIFPEACVSITSLRKVNIPDNCRVHSGAFAHCGIEELILGENVILEEDCFEGIRAKIQKNFPKFAKIENISSGLNKVLTTRYGKLNLSKLPLVNFLKMFVMTWEEAIVKVLAEERGPMHYVEITQRIISRGYYEPRGVTPENSVGMYLRKNPNLFERVSKGVYKLKE